MNTFSVCQFWGDKHHYARRYVDAEEATVVFNHIVSMGLVDRVVIVDGLDHINYEWKRGIGITFPREGQGGEELRDD